MEYCIENTHLRVILTSVGAEMQSIVKDNAEYLWSGDASYWSEKAPILFPFVGRLTDGKYTLDGKEYRMEIHGFARKLPYMVVDQERDSITFELTDSRETYCSYPYRFRLRVTYMLNKERIDILYSVKNESEQTMYFGIGGHPGFRVPLEKGLEFEDYYLEFGQMCQPDKVEHTETCFLNGENRQFKLQDNKKVSLSHTLFDNDAIVLSNMADTVTLESDKGKRKIKVSYPQMPYLGIWHTPNTEAPYICIEPWTSLPSRQGVVEELQCKSDLIRLASKEVYENKWSIEVY